MSKTIDQKVVEMRFDNKQFEAGAAQTMGTLKKLKGEVDFTKTDHGVEKLVNDINNKLSPLKGLVNRQMTQIVDNITGTFKNLLRDTFITPIKSGFEEYETQMNAVQTILANTQKEGTNIKDVNAALDELNLYADKTIYNFTEMTRNIGTFTAAGVKLKTSVAAIQGIANLAAVSGSNSQQASTAMYQLSQALAAGSVKLQDWNSVVNAGMGGQVFQNALKETSRLLGTGVDAAIAKTGSFRESLKSGWITAQVLTDTLKKFTTSGALEYISKYTGLTETAITKEIELAKSVYGEEEAYNKAAEAIAKKTGKDAAQIAQTLTFAQTAEDAATKVKTFTQLIDTLQEALQSGWSQSFRIIIGDFEDAKTIFTKISDSLGAMIGEFSDARNKLLSEAFDKKNEVDFISLLSGRTKDEVKDLYILADALGTTSEEFKKVVNAVAGGNPVLASVITSLVNMSKSGKTTVEYMTEVTGFTAEQITALEELGVKYGYASDEFNEYLNTLSKGDTTIKRTVVELLKMRDFMDIKSGRELLFDALTNSGKALLSVLKPIQTAFREAIPAMTGDQIYKMLESLSKFTASLSLSEWASESLRRTFKGLFDVVKLLGDGFLFIVKLIVPVHKPIGSLIEGILTLTGWLGSLLSMFVSLTRSSTAVGLAMNYLQDMTTAAWTALSNLIKSGIDFIAQVSQSEGAVRLITAIGSAFERLGKFAAPYIKMARDEADKMIGSLIDFGGLDVAKGIEWVSKAFSNLATSINNFSFQTLKDGFKSLKDRVKALKDIVMSNEGIAAFIRNMKQYGLDLKEALSWDNLMIRLEKIMKVFGRFYEWIKNMLAPAFADFNLASLAAVAGGGGIIYAMVRIANAFGSISDIFSGIPDVLEAATGALGAYQHSLNASAIIKIAGAIAILAAALVLLSFADPDRLAVAFVALGGIAAILLFGVTQLINAINQGKKATKALEIFASGFSCAMKKVASGLQIRMIGGAIKNFAISVGIIAGSIIALGIYYRKDPQGFQMAVNTITWIGAVLIALGALLVMSSTVMPPNSGKAIAGIGTSILFMTLSLGLIILSISKLMKMEIPDDFDVKRNLLIDIFVGFVGLILVLAGSTILTQGRALPAIAGTFKSMALVLLATVLAMKLLFDMKLPDDANYKLGILAGIFVAFALLIRSMGVAAGLSGGNAFKAGSTILALAGFLVVVVGALFVLTLLPVDKLIYGAMGLGVVLASLGAALYGAGQVSKKHAYKSIIAMAITVGAITAALGVLSMIPLEKMIPSAIALGAILYILSLNFNALSSFKKKNVLPMIVAISSMIVAMIAIATSLYILSTQPWEGLAAAGVAMAATMFVFAKAFDIVLKRNWSQNTPAKIGMFGLMVATTAIVAAELYFLANQPWANMLAAAAAMSGTLLAFSLAFEIVLKKNWSQNTPAKIGMFALMVATTAIVAAELYFLASKPWESLLAGALALSGTLLAFTGCFAIISAVQVNPLAIAAVLAGAVGLWLIGNAIGNLAKYDSKELLSACLALGGMLLALSGVLVILSIVGAAAPAALTGMALLAGFIAGFAFLLTVMGAIFKIDSVRQLLNGGIDILIQIGKAIGDFVGAIVGGIMTGVSAALPQVGLDLSKFMDNLKPFIVGMKQLDAESLKCVGYLAAIVLALTAAEVVNGIASFFGLSLVSLGTELSNFIIALEPFIKGSTMLSSDSMEACKYLAEMIIILTGAQLLAGIGQFFGLTGKLSDFAAELEAFGPSIANFAEQVKDVKPEAVQGAAAAASIMAEVAGKLQGHGGIIQEIMGDKSLATFAAELEAFGPSIANFAEQVKDVKPEAVQGAAAAASIMAEVAGKLQGHGGIMQQLAGEKSLSLFAKELMDFGPSIADFADKVQDVKPEAVQGAAAAATMMADMANKIGNQGGLIAKIIGDNTLGSFGKELEAFGPSIKKFSDNAGALDVAKIQNAATSFQALVNLANNVQYVSTNSIKLFADAFGKISTDGVKKFADGFSGSSSVATASVNVFFNTMKSSIENNSEKSGKAMQKVVDKMIDVLKKATTEAEKSGKNIVEGLARGITNNVQLVSRSMTSLAQGLTKTFNVQMSIQSPSRVMEKAGMWIDKGLADGIDKNSKYATKASEKLGSDTLKSFNDRLGIHSPATELIKSGKDCVDGVIKGVKEKAGELKEVVSGTAKDSVLEPAKEKMTELNEAAAENGDEFKSIVKENNDEVVEEEQGFWDKMLEIRKAGLDGFKYKDKTTMEFQRDMLSETADILKNYSEKLKSSIDSAASSLSIFEAIEKKDKVKKEDLFKNMDDQLKEYACYIDNLSTLNQRLDGTALIEYLRTLGVESLDKLQGINSMTDEELTKYSQLYDTKMALAKEVAGRQLVDLERESEQKLQSLFGMMDQKVNLYDFATKFDGTIQSIEKYITGLQNQSSSVMAAGEGVGAELVTSMARGVEQNIPLFIQLVDASLSNAEISIDFMDNAIEEAKEAAKEKGKKVGKSLGEGIGAGMGEADYDEPSKAAVDLVTSDLAKNALINSPSHVTRDEIGIPLGEGIAVGLEEGAKTYAPDAAANVMTTIVKAFDKHMETAKIEGQTIFIKMLDGMTAGISDDVNLTNLSTTFNTLITKFMAKFKDTHVATGTFKALGLAVCQGMKDGIVSNEKIVTDAAKTLGDNVYKAIKDNMGRDVFYELGKNAADGLAAGIRDNVNSVSESAISAAKSAVNAAKTALQVKSPSRIMMKIGAYFDEGFAIGVTNNTKMISKAVENMADDTIDVAKDSLYSINTMLSGDNYDMSPVIRPTMDLSEINKGFDEVSNMMNRTYDLSAVIDKAMDASRSFDGNRASKVRDDSGSSTKSIVNNYDFTQNNYSPKALSRIDIYRQTNSQFTSFRRAVNPV